MASRWCISCLVAGVLGAAEPANPAANARVRSILDYISGLSARQEKRLLSGQYTDLGPDGAMTDVRRAVERTGHWPALVGFDYFLGAATCHHPETDRAAAESWQQGMLVTISAHAHNPMRPEGGGLRDKPIDLRVLLDEASEAHGRWMKALDTMADGLQVLRDQGVVVLWRPFHEMNGRWFWWGGSDPAVFHQVWRQMFEHYVKKRKLDNLLWVYSPNHGERTGAYFPGERYVDLVGVDAYTDEVDAAHIRGVDEVLALGKPFGFTEYGPHGPSKPPGTYDYRRFIAGLSRDFPRAVFFMSWCGKWGLGGNDHGKELLEHPWMVNRDGLPAAWFPPH